MVCRWPAMRRQFNGAGNGAESSVGRVSRRRMKYSKLLFENSFRFPQTCKFENNKKKRVSVRTVSTEYAIDRRSDAGRGREPAGGGREPGDRESAARLERRAPAGTARAITRYTKG